MNEKLRTFLIDSFRVIKAYSMTDKHTDWDFTRIIQVCEQAITKLQPEAAKDVPKERVTATEVVTKAMFDYKRKLTEAEKELLKKYDPLYPLYSGWGEYFRKQMSKQESWSTKNFCEKCNNPALDGELHECQPEPKPKKRGREFL